MKLSFSTRGWPSLSWTEMTGTAIDMGFSGVEVYNLHANPALTDRGAPFHKYNTPATARELREKQLTVPCFDTSIDISAGNCELGTVTALMETAKSARVPFVTLCALTDNEAAVYAALSSLLPSAESLGVTILVKTSGIYSDTARLRNMLDRFASDNLAVLWDIHHPYRDNGESADTTIKNLGCYVKHVHMRDSDDTGAYQLIGEGTMPIDDVMRALSSVNYDNFISLEWKPEWLDDLQDPEIIFPYFVNFMSRFSSTRDMKKKLYFNHDGTGQYIWKKEELLDLTF